MSGLDFNNFAVSEGFVATVGADEVAGPAVTLGSLTPVGDINIRPTVATVIVMDYSGSILEDLGEDMRVAMENAAKGYVDQMGEGDQAEIIKFADVEQVMVGMTSNKDELKKAIDTPPSVGEWTDLYDAIFMGIQHAEGKAPRVAVVVLTDGYDRKNTLDEPKSEAGYLDVIGLARTKGVPVFAVHVDVDGVPQDLAVTPLQDIAFYSGGHFYGTSSPDRVGTIYLQLATIFKNQYRLIYESGVHKTSDESVTLVTATVQKGTISVDSAAMRYMSCD